MNERTGHGGGVQLSCIWTTPGIHSDASDEQWASGGKVKKAFPGYKTCKVSQKKVRRDNAHDLHVSVGVRSWRVPMLRKKYDVFVTLTPRRN